MSKAYQSRVWLSHSEPTGWRVSFDVGEFVEFDGKPSIKRGPLIFTDTTGWRESKAEALLDAAMTLEATGRAILEQAEQLRTQAGDEVPA